MKWNWRSIIFLFFFSGSGKWLMLLFPFETMFLLGFVIRKVSIREQKYYYFQSSSKNFENQFCVKIILNYIPFHGGFGVD